MSPEGDTATRERGWIRQVSKGRGLDSVQDVFVMIRIRLVWSGGLAARKKAVQIRKNRMWMDEASWHLPSVEFRFFLGKCRGGLDWRLPAVGSGSKFGGSQAVTVEFRSFQVFHLLAAEAPARKQRGKRLPTGDTGDGSFPSTASSRA